MEYRGSRVRPTAMGRGQGFPHCKGGVQFYIQGAEEEEGESEGTERSAGLEMKGIIWYLGETKQDPL